MKVLGMFLLGIPLGIFRAYVFAVMWNWFVTPWSGVEMNILMAYGSMILFNFVNVSMPKEENSTWEYFIKQYAFGVMYTLIVWGISAIVSMFL